MFAALFRNENTKLYRRSLLWIELAVAAVLIIFISVVSYSVSHMPAARAGQPGGASMLEMVTWPVAVTNGGLALNIAGAASLGGFLVMLLAATVATQEYTWRTLHLSVSRGVSRGALLLSKLLALVLPVALIIAVTWVVNILVSGLLTLLTQGSLPFAAVQWGNTALSALLMLASLLPYLALTLLVGVATRSLVAAAGITIGFALLGEPLLSQLCGLLGGPIAYASAYLPAGLARGFLGMLTQQSLPNAPAPWLAGVGILVYTALFAGLAVLAFRKQDLTA